MDLDRYIQRNDSNWRRLEYLTTRGRKLASEDLEELVKLYPRVSADLSHARARYADPDLNARLSAIVGNANNLIYAAPRRSKPKVQTFFVETFPAAVWSGRIFIVIAALCLFVPAIGMGFWLNHSGSTLDAAVSPEMQKLLAQREFRAYYSSQAASDFSVQLMLNNIRVALLAFALGVIPLVGTGWILISNGIHLGVMAAVMHHAGEGVQFWALITPHGLLELSSVVVAGAAGLRLSWSLIAPGDRTRLESFAREGLRSVIVAGGLACCFVVAALLEAFITPSGLPAPVRIAIGVGVFAAFVAYIVSFGASAERRGITGLAASLSEPTGSFDHEVRVTEL
ncbi:MAG: stage II sporulation protein M [Microthrixaceae bacterium]|nr:stage II sporulation protein M [Microthrixaceae bacterium]